MDRRETVLLAKNYEPNKHNIIGWYASEKLDGVRCIWDGGISRGLPVNEVPWANIDKHYRYKNEIRATGLWTRYFQSIQAPPWFINRLPPFALDGELWGGVGKFQTVVSTIKKLIPIDEEWKDISFQVFDVPSLASILKIGKINNPNIKKEINQGMLDWALNRLKVLGMEGKRPCVFNFDEVVDYLDNDFISNDSVEHLIQIKIRNVGTIESMMDLVEMQGGEGLILRNGNHQWEPKRSPNVLKVKRRLDSEAVVVGYRWGKQTDLGSKLLGLMGSLIVNWKGIIFELSGFTDEERRMVFKGTGGSAKNVGENYPGERVDSSLIINPMFPIGSIVSFRYRCLTDSGIPKEASYYRKH